MNLSEMKWTKPKPIWELEDKLNFFDDDSSLSSISTDSFSSTLDSSSLQSESEISLTETDFSERYDFSNERNWKWIRQAKEAPKISAIDELAKTLSLRVDGDTHEDAVNASFLKVVNMLRDADSNLNALLNMFADEEHYAKDQDEYSESEATRNSFLGSDTGPRTELNLPPQRQTTNPDFLSERSTMSGRSRLLRRGSSDDIDIDYSDIRGSGRQRSNDSILSEYSDSSLSMFSQFSDISIGRKQRRWGNGPCNDYFPPKRRNSLDHLPMMPSRNSTGDYDHPKKKKSVTFDRVDVRLYEVTLGDNPTMSSGPSISIGWNYETCLPVSIDEWEIDHFSKRSRPSRLAISKEKREQMAKEMGFSDAEICENVRYVQKINAERIQTVNFLAVEALEKGKKPVTEKRKSYNRWGS